MTTIVDKEYSSKVFRTLLAVPNFSKVAVAEVFCKKGALENFANHRCFSINFARFSNKDFRLILEYFDTCSSARKDLHSFNQIDKKTRLHYSQTCITNFRVKIIVLRSTTKKAMS